MKLGYKKNNLDIKIFFSLFNKVNIIIYKNKMNLNKMINKAFSRSIKDYKKYVNIVKNSEYKIEELKIGIDIGADDVILTTFGVFILSNIISILTLYLNDKMNHQNVKYFVRPSYNKILFQVDLHSIISIKLTHIIYIIYRIKRERRNNNVRSSNRKSYGFCND